MIIGAPPTFCLISNHLPLSPFDGNGSAEGLGDILRAVDSKDLTALALLDLSAAFDIVDHATLLECLRLSYGLGSYVHDDSPLFLQ